MFFLGGDGREFGAERRPKRGHVEMDGGDRAAMVERHPSGDQRPPIAALNSIALIAQHLAHQVMHHAGNLPRADRCWRCLGKAVSGQGRDDDVKIVPQISAIAGRVGQGSDYFLKFEY